MPGVALRTAVTSLLFLSGSGCLSYHHATRVIHESGTGSVYFEERPATPIRASHPVSVHPTTLARVLQGVQIQEHFGRPIPSGTDELPATPVFSEKDIAFLAPYLSAALIMAGREQQIAFRIIHPTEFGPAATAGTLFAQGSLLYLTLTHFDYRPFRPEILYRTQTPLPPSPALTRRTLRFIPQAVGRPVDKKPPGVPIHPTLTTLAIDYHRMVELASDALVPEDQQAEPEKHHVSNDSADRRDAELQAMNLRIQVLKTQLAQRAEVIKKLKRATLVAKLRMKKKPTGSRKKNIARKPVSATPRGGRKVQPPRKDSQVDKAKAPTVTVLRHRLEDPPAAKPSPPDPVGQPETVDKAAQPAEGKSEGQPEIQGPPAPPPPEPPKKPTVVGPSPADDAVESGYYVVALFFGTLAFIGIRRFSPAR